MRFVYAGEGLGLDGVRDLVCVDKEGDVGAWVLLCRSKFV